MTKFKITVLETVTVQRKIVYEVEAENEQEILDCKGKSIQHLNIVDTEVNMGEVDIDVPIIKEILKAKVVPNNTNENI